jgi:TonB family protein
MTMLGRRIALAVLFGVLTAPQLHAQDALTAARDLYASAQYDEALKILNRLSDRSSENEEQQSIDLYRSLCLLAVGRRDDANSAIEAIVARDPLYRPATDLPPRTRAAFSDVKKRVLPTIVQQQYGEARSAFEREEFETAAATFQRIIAAIDDPDIQTAAALPPLADLRTLAVGFHDLSTKSMALPPPPPPPAPVAVPKPVVPAPPRIYTGEEADVRPPVTIVQDLPRFLNVVPPGGIRGVVEIVIGEHGRVESATMVVPVASSYDKLVLSAANTWQFRPALRNGAPVKFRKRIQINIAPPVR